MTRLTAALATLRLATCHPHFLVVETHSNTSRGDTNLFLYKRSKSQVQFKGLLGTKNESLVRSRVRCIIWGNDNRFATPPPHKNWFCCCRTWGICGTLWVPQLFSIVYSVVVTSFDQLFDRTVRFDSLHTPQYWPSFEANNYTVFCGGSNLYSP